ncbi:MAG: efflux RND transporter periplasmic adaptor subunit [Alphaproteobacteria bacterium]|nr:efflux RND transporter periplasmic adaptor subunit [Alphaproteobacteria bacterium]
MRLSLKGPIAVGIAAVATLWILSGQFGGAKPEAATPPTGNAAASTGHAGAEARPVVVRVARLEATAHPLNHKVTGRTEARRRVELRAETAGRVVELPVRRGDRVEKGDVIARLATDDRKARLAEADALLRQRQIEHAAAADLARKGYRAETGLAAAQAQLDGARAAVEQIRLEIARTEIRAPFAGVIGASHVEIGDYLSVGGRVAAVVDLDPMLVVAQASELAVGGLKRGRPASATIIGGAGGAGTITFVASEADPKTRTFRVEVEISNADHTLRDGMTAQLSFPLGDRRGYLVPSSVLTLADDGTVGVKLVGADNRVVFDPVEIIDDTPDGLWIAGLPDAITLVTVGQETVSPGQTVDPVEASLPGATRGAS